MYIIANIGKCITVYYYPQFSHYITAFINQPYNVTSSRVVGKILKRFNNATIVCEGHKYTIRLTPEHMFEAGAFLKYLKYVSVVNTLKEISLVKVLGLYPNNFESLDIPKSLIDDLREAEMGIGSLENRNY